MTMRTILWILSLGEQTGAQIDELQMVTELPRGRVKIRESRWHIVSCLITRWWSLPHKVGWLSSELLLQSSNLLKQPLFTPNWMYVHFNSDSLLFLVNVDQRPKAWLQKPWWASRVSGYSPVFCLVSDSISSHKASLCTRYTIALGPSNYLTGLQCPGLHSLWREDSVILIMVISSHFHVNWLWRLGFKSLLYYSLVAMGKWFKFRCLVSSTAKWEY